MHLFQWGVGWRWLCKESNRMVSEWRVERGSHTTTLQVWGHLFLTAFYGGVKKKSRKTKVKQYKEVGRSGTEAGGADQTFHPPAEVKDRQEPHCFHHIRNQKEPKSRRIKSHWKSEALLWLSRAQGHTCCRTGMFSAYLCGHARPPVTTGHTHMSWLSSVSLHCRKHTSLKSTGKMCMDDSGGYTMKWRRVNPNPWGVRRSSTVLGLGHENSSSGGSCIAGEPAKLLQSGESFCERRQREGKWNEPAGTLTDGWTGCRAQTVRQWPVCSLEAMHALSYALSTCGQCQ